MPGLCFFNELLHKQADGIVSKKSPGKREIHIEGAKAASKTDLRRTMLLLAGIMFLTILIYSNSLSNTFINFDDPESVFNKYIREINVANLIHYFTTPVQYMYMPLAMISYAVDYQIGKLDPFIYHLDNLIIHLCCVVLVFLVIRRLTKKSRTALFASLLFAIHPVAVDTVSSIATRTNLLITLFFLAALLCYSFYIEKNRVRYLILASLSFLLAAFAKSSAVILPLVLFLWDYFYDRPLHKKLVVEKIPFFVISLLFGILTLVMRVDVGNSISFNLIDRVFMFFYSLLDYGIRLFFPLQLSMSYAYPVKNGMFLPIQFYLAPLILALAVWGLWKLKVSKKILIVGLSFFVLNVVLSQSVLLIDNFMANRYVYLSYLGLYLILAETGDGVLSNFREGWKSRMRVIWVLASLILVVGFSLLTYARNFVWHDTMTLLDDVIKKQPGQAWVYSTRGLTKLEADDFEGARADLDISLHIDPDFAPSLNYRGIVNYITHDYQAALSDLNKAISNDPNDKAAYRVRGKVKMAMQDNLGAMDDFNRAIALNPQSDARFWRGFLKSMLGDYQGAHADFSAIIAYVPDDGRAYFWRGMVEQNLNDQAAADADIAKAQSLGYQPSDGQAGLDTDDVQE
jgi:tetratricopeptide (TPR) repeat protein